jgi:hypothetical protein
MPKPRARRIVRDSCEACGVNLFAGPRYVTLHDGARRIRLCRPCVEDAFAREDAEARWQRDLLEAVWELTPRQTGLGGEEGEVSVP